MKTITLLVFAAAMVAISSCKKDDNNSSTPSNNATKKELLTAKKWKGTGLTLGGADVWAQLDDCDKDDIHTFQANGVYIEDEGATKCGPSDPQVITTSTWAFIENDTKLVYDGDTAKINELSSTKLVLQGDFLGAAAIATFSAQ